MSVEQIISDPESLSRLGKLALAFDREAQWWQDSADRAAQDGRVGRVRRCEREADICRQAAERIRMRLLSLHGLTEGDVAVCQQVAVSTDLAGVLARLPDDKFQQIAPTPAEEPEPPHQLVPFVEWLRGKIGRYLPWVSAETWQRAAFVLLWERRAL